MWQMRKRNDNTEIVLHRWEQINKRIYWAVYGIVGDRQLAEDAIQEALLIAIDKYHTLKDPAKFEPWLVKIAIRVAYSLIDLDHKVYSMDALENGEFFETHIWSRSIDESLLLPEYRELVLSIITNLKPEKWKYLFYLRYIEDKSLEDIGEITGTKEGTLKAIFHRMRCEISVMLAQEYSHGKQN